MKELFKNFLIVLLFVSIIIFFIWIFKLANIQDKKNQKEINEKVVDCVSRDNKLEWCLQNFNINNQ